MATPIFRVKRASNSQDTVDYILQRVARNNSLGNPGFKFLTVTTTRQSKFLHVHVCEKTKYLTKREGFICVRQKQRFLCDTKQDHSSVIRDTKTDFAKSIKFSLTFQECRRPQKMALSTYICTTGISENMK